MATNVGINGFGRIGRQVLRAIMERHPDQLNVVAVNDLGKPSDNAHLFKYDSTYGVYPGKVSATDDSIEIDGNSIRVLSERDPAQLPWGDLGADVVVESTGFFTDAGAARGHIKGGAKKVIISAPAKGEDLTVVLGVNEDNYDPDQHDILSNASCTTNCIATMVKVLNDNFGVERGLMTTVHAYTNDQKILDQVHEDLRRARAAALNIIPTSTGAARAVGLVLPELDGKIHGMAMRVPTATVSVTDFVANLGEAASVDEINDAYKAAASTTLNGILEYTDEPLVSSDFKLNTHSSIIDGLSTMSMGGDLVKVVGWYDNEWGYSCRTADLAAFLADKGL
ncbi:MAG: type I glyceraldehyde-3-phosphate dehydrogenase [Chloroflexi bacterium]|jgi:glyceraldehyde 3-phosphate dehydrogenase|nr:type I glyceraldehyde-3-phosphate dehydrogenase [Chloroflexota bacterium]MDP6063340.1 type I glyceraldehyde-3-phosphate dehydrogenase [SAR202 cluster bacterium]HAL47655.1 type I glyceraldehyde-3-phosphate dehydrogenase [Dehalococcoidia bacterium]|tara:strand:- start:882 stop:1895 length:1014 start_codon:yes stop_codon:yes gene_type:complete